MEPPGKTIKFTNIATLSRFSLTIEDSPLAELVALLEENQKGQVKDLICLGEPLVKDYKILQTELYTDELASDFLMVAITTDAPAALPPPVKEETTPQNPTPPVKAAPVNQQVAPRCTITPVPLLLPATIRAVEDRTDFCKLLRELGYTRKPITISHGQEEMTVGEFTKQEAIAAGSSFVLNYTLKSFFEGFNEPFVVVSVSGPTRSGKSTFMTHLMRLLTNRNDGSFEVSNQPLSCTLGIWLWPEFIRWTSPSGQVRNILLLDVEGLYGVDPLSSAASGDYFFQLFAFTSMISSVVMFNTNMSVTFDQKSWNELSELSGALQVLSCNENRATQFNWKKHSPKFLYVARNHNSFKTIQEDQKTWDGLIRDPFGMDNWTKELKLMFGETFQASYFVSLMTIAPATDQDSWDLQNLTLDQTNPRFKQKIIDFRDNLLPLLLDTDLQVTNAHVVGQQVQFDKPCAVLPNVYFHILEKFLGLVSTKKLENLGESGIVVLAREGQAKSNFKKLIDGLRKFIGAQPMPFLENELEISIAKQIDNLIQAQIDYCYSEGVPNVKPYTPESVRSEMEDFYAEILRKNAASIDGACKAYLDKKNADYMTIGEHDIHQWLSVVGLAPALVPHKAIVSGKLKDHHEAKMKRASQLVESVYLQSATAIFQGIGIPTTFTTSVSVLSFVQHDLSLTFDACNSLKVLEVNAKVQAAVASFLNLTRNGYPSWVRAHDHSGDFAFLFTELRNACLDRSLTFKGNAYKEVAHQLLVPVFFPSILYPFETEDFDIRKWQQFILQEFKQETLEFLELLTRIKNLDTMKLESRGLTQQELEIFQNTTSETLQSLLASSDRQLIIGVQKFDKDEIVDIRLRLKLVLALTVGEKALIGTRELTVTETHAQFLCTFREASNAQEIMAVNLGDLTASPLLAYHVIVQGQVGSYQKNYSALNDFCRFCRIQVNAEPKFSTEFDSVLLSSGAPLDNLYNAKRIHHKLLPPIHARLSEDQLQAHSRLIILKTLVVDTNLYDCVLWPCEESSHVQGASNQPPQQQPAHQKPISDQFADNPQFVPPQPEQDPNHAPPRPTAPAGGLYELPGQEVLGFNDTSPFTNLYDQRLQFGLFNAFHHPSGWCWSHQLFKFLYSNRDQTTHPREKWKDSGLSSFRTLVAAVTDAVSKCGYYHLQSGKRVDIPQSSLSQQIPFLIPLQGGPQYPRTIIKFQDIDTFDCAAQMLADFPNDKVLVLNMANSQHAGGGWESGKMAQEEDLFRRSNLCTTLVGSNPQCYPIPEFSALISKDVAVFRGNLSEGYPFLENPFLIDVLSACAYDKNRVGAAMCYQIPTDGQPIFRLQPEFVANTYRKILTLIHYAAQEGYQKIVFGAIGCGAFGNPPQDIAMIFHHALAQYAGYLPEITFAILGDENRLAFQREIKEVYEGNKTFGVNPDLPLREWSNETYICPFGGLCIDLENDQHMRECYHPQECPGGANCPMLQDSVHNVLFKHPMDCADWVLCPRFFDVAHQKAFNHPPKCLLYGCQDSTGNHWHPPICRFGLQCEEFKTNSTGEHANTWRHEVVACPQGLLCRLFRDEEHNLHYSHAFLPVCKHGITCTVTKQDHKSKYSHICTQGAVCEKISDPNHIREFYHFLNHPCFDGSQCKRIDEDHLDAFSHPGVPDVRPLCANGDACKERDNILHVRKNSHLICQLKTVAPVNPASVAVRYKGFFADPQTPNLPPVVEDLDLAATRIPYFENVYKANFELKEWGKKEGQSVDTNSANFQRIVQHMNNLKPVHRLPKDTFVSVLKTGALMSLHQLKGLTIDSILPLVLSNPDVQDHLAKNLHNAALKEFIKSTIAFGLQAAQKEKFEKDKSVDHPFSEQVYQQAKFEYENRKNLAKSGFQPIVVEVLEATATMITQACSSIGSNPKVGIGYHVDEICGTDKTVFATHGPNGGKQYGHISIVMKPIIKWHPNFYLLPHAATYFYREPGKAAPPTGPWTTFVRPWGKWFDDWETTGKQHYFSNKWHPIAPLLGEFLALDFVARNAHVNKCAWTDITLEEIEKNWQTIDSHKILEGHLPYQVPLSYVETVIMTESIWNSLSESDKKLATKLFGKNIVKTKSDEESFAESSKLAVQKNPDAFCGFCFAIDPPKITGNEVFVPLKLAHSRTKQGFFLFETVGSGFVFCLCDKENLEERKQVSIVFKDQGCSISTASTLLAISGVQNSDGKKGFNLGLDTSKRIHYSVHVDLNTRTVTVSHYGVSELYSCASQNVVLRCDPTFPLESLVFPSINVFGGKTVEFYNFRSSLSPVQSVFNSPDQLIQPVVQLSVPQTSMSPPFCSADRNCLCYFKRPDDHGRVSHMNQESHTCQWGSQCKLISNPEHLRVTDHVALPRCQDGNQCQGLTDPHHRSQYAHKDFWDWMLVCQRGSKCQGCDPTRYYHL